MWSGGLDEFRGNACDRALLGQLAPCRSIRGLMEQALGIKQGRTSAGGWEEQRVLRGASDSAKEVIWPMSESGVLAECQKVCEGLWDVAILDKLTRSSES
jgi:hypothetical protein